MNPHDSMAEQLCALYAEKEILESRFPGMSAAEIVEAATGVRPAEPQELSVLDADADSMEAQLVELYADRQILAEAFPGMDVDEIVRADFPDFSKAAS